MSQTFPAPLPSEEQPGRNIQPDRHSARYDVLRVGACLAVILLHLSATIVMERELFGSIHWHLSNAIDAATRWCVPVFVMLSGALLLNPQKYASPRDFWTKRMSRLLPAVIAWPAIYFAWRAFYWHEPLSIEVIAHDLVVGRPYVHLYFLFLITGLYLVTPFLAKAIGTFSRSQLRDLILIMACLAMGANLFDFLASSAVTIFVPYLTYYLAGWYCARLPLERPTIPAFAIGFAAATTTILTALLVSTRGYDDRWAFYFYEDFSPTVMVMAIGLFLLTLHGTIPPRVESFARRLAPLTLGVYVAHPIVVELLRYGYFLSAPILLSPPYYVPITFLATCALTFGLIALLQKIPGLRRIV
ncbi:MAG TPA: acyltransferase family protein [Nitrospira sp.]|nr:acyltransferase family protein [Nitrospira sp.]